MKFAVLRAYPVYRETHFLKQLRLRFPQAPQVTNWMCQFPWARWSLLVLRMKEILQQFLPTILICYFLGFPEIQDPQNEWFIMEHVKILRGSPILGNLHIYIYIIPYYSILFLNASWRRRLSHIASERKLKTSVMPRGQFDEFYELPVVFLRWPAEQWPRNEKNCSICVTLQVCPRAASRFLSWISAKPFKTSCMHNMRIVCNLWVLQPNLSACIHKRMLHCLCYQT